MWRAEDVLRELKEEGVLERGTCEKDGAGGGLPPGFRFHPTDEELITFYLASKVFSITTTNLFFSCSGVEIAEVDLTRCEPWDLPERAKIGEKEWYLYSLRDRKYPSGLRTNRATETGYWKATGKDRQVYGSGMTTAAGGAGGVLIGMKKTLVFYQGRAPRGDKTRWVMHEYRLGGHFSSSFRLSSKEEWVICRIFHKNAEKKLSQVIHPSHPPPLSLPLPPLSPFFSSLHSLTETTACSNDTSSQPRNNYSNHDLLHSLLSNPLPNFSFISGSDTIFPPLNTSTTTTAILGSISPSSPTLFKSFDHPQLRYLSSTTPTSTAAKTGVPISKQWQQQQQQRWLNTICPQSQYYQNQYYQNQYHDHPIDQMMDPQPIPNTYTTSTGYNNDDDKNVDAAVAVHVEMSPSFAAAALDRMLNHRINQQHPAESWSFLFHP